MFILVKFAGSYMAELVKPDTVWYGFGVAGLVCLGAVFYFMVNFIVSSPELAMLKQGITNDRD